MVNNIKRAFNVLLTIWGVFTLVYLTILFTPPSYFVTVEEFRATDTIVGGYTHIQSERTAKWGLGGRVQEEINIVRDDYTEVVYRKDREVFTERGTVKVDRKIDYKHTEPGNYLLHLHIVHDIGFMGIKKVLNLNAKYKVTF